MTPDKGSCLGSRCHRQSIRRFVRRVTHDRRLEVCHATSVCLFCSVRSCAVGNFSTVGEVCPVGGFGAFVERLTAPDIDEIGPLCSSSALSAGEA